MGLLDDLLRGALGGGSSQLDPRGSPAPPSAQAGGGMGSVMMALLPVVLSMLASRGGGRGGGGGLGDILGQVLGGGQPGGGGLTDIIGGMAGRGVGQEAGMGGLGGLVEHMQRAGYGDQARSWVGTGQNMPINPGALEEIFGQGGLDEIAQRAGITREQASEGMAELLPEVVNHVTPGGEGTDFDQLTQSVDDLRRRMGS
jgi:uncharacterized protein YidB (DUF937 family)